MNLKLNIMENFKPTATLKNIVSGETIQVMDTTDSPASSHGNPVWVDKDGNPYCQVGMESPFYEIIKIYE
jgi:hypothetical protein